MPKITKLTVGKGKTTRRSEQEEWLKEYYELEIELNDPSELEVAKANATGVIDGWLSQISSVSKTPETKIPNIDLHTLEHDPEWRSWRKDEKGNCTFPAEEGKAGWIRIKNAGNHVLTLVQSMKNQGLERVTLGLFQYKLSGEGFLQRRPLKKPEENNPHTRIDQNLRNIKAPAKN